MMRQDPASSDESLRAEIIAVLAADSRTAHADLRVGVLNGIVHLAGRLMPWLNAPQRSAGRAGAWRARGGEPDLSARRTQPGATNQPGLEDQAITF